MKGLIYLSEFLSEKSAILSSSFGHQSLPRNTLKVNIWIHTKGCYRMFYYFCKHTFPAVSSRWDYDTLCRVSGVVMFPVQQGGWRRPLIAMKRATWVTMRGKERRTRKKRRRRKSWRRKRTRRWSCVRRELVILRMSFSSCWVALFIVFSTLFFFRIQALLQTVKMTRKRKKRKRRRRSNLIFALVFSFVCIWLKLKNVCCGLLCLTGFQLLFLLW